MPSETTIWDDIPREVQRLFLEHIGPATAIVILHPDKPQYWEVVDEQYGSLPFGKIAGMFKRADNKDMRGPLAWITDIWAAPQKPLGGPNPVTALFTTAALGYGVGWLLDKLKGFVTEEDSRIWRKLGLIGGTLLPTIWGIANVANYGWKGLFSSGPFFKTQEDNPFVDTLKSYTGLFLKEDVDAARWIRTVTGDPYSPPQVRGVASGIPMAAAMSKGGSRWISPFDIARIAAGAGLGGFMGLGLGRVAQALTGLPDKYVEQLKQMGVVAGALKTVMPELFVR